MTDDRAISLNAVLTEVSRWIGYLDEDMISRIQIGIKRLPSVTSCEDAISRDAVIKLAYDMSEIDGEHFGEPCMVVDVEDIQQLPSVTPKTGHWKVMYEPKNMVVCSKCGKCAYLYNNRGSAYCPHCGCAMFEPQEGAIRNDKRRSNS